jgi:hypothetical protein
MNLKEANLFRCSRKRGAVECEACSDRRHASWGNCCPDLDGV